MSPLRRPGFAPAAGDPAVPGGSDSHGPRRATVPVALAVIAVAAVGAVGLAPSSGRVPVAVAVAVGLVGAALLAVLAARQAANARRLTGEVASLRAELDRRSHGVEQLAGDTLPKVVALLRAGTSIDEAVASVPDPDDEAERRVLHIVAAEVGRGDRMRAAAMAACANAAGRVQALATSMLADLREMEDRHSEEVLGDLLRLDHSTAQAGRLADSIAVLTGARSGRRWTKPIVMESILRGALGRISAYQRVRLHSTSTVAVAGYAAEGVMHALAELMDNATRFSPPSEEVHVYVEEVQAGIVVAVEDGGLVMGPAALNRAERAVSAEALDLTTLSGTRLGLAVVGVLARKHGLTVSFRPSSRGGTGAIVIIPRQLLTQPRPDDALPAGTRRAIGERAGRPRPEAGDGFAPGAGDDLVPGAGDGFAPGAGDGFAPGDGLEPGREASAASRLADTGPLPKRDRGHTLAASSRPRPAPAAENRDTRPPAGASAGARFGAFQRASRLRQTDPGTGTPRTEPPADDERGR